MMYEDELIYKIKLLNESGYDDPDDFVDAALEAVGDWLDYIIDDRSDGYRCIVELAGYE